MARVWFEAVVLVVLVAGVGCATAPTAVEATAAAEPGSGVKVELSGLSFVAPASWEAEAPDNEFRLAQYHLPVEGAADKTTVVIYYFGAGGAGTITDNFSRWRAQFEGAGAEAGTVTHAESDGIAIHTLDLEGTFIAEVPPGSGVRVNRPDHRMLASVISTKAGFYYIKLIGPRASVERFEASWQAFLRSIRAAPVLDTRTTAELGARPGPG